MKYDYKTLYEKNAAFYHAHENAKTALRIGNIALTALFPAAYLGVWLYAVFFAEFTPQTTSKLFFVPALAFFLVSVLRLAVRRPRPYSEKGARIAPLIARSDRDEQSFPSRHAACAAVLAVTLLPLLPLLGATLLLCSLALGYARFALGLHYPSDIFAGLGLGAAVGCLTFLL